MHSDFQRQLAAAFYLTTRQRVDSDSLHDAALRRFIRREARISGRPPNRQYPGLWAVPKPAAYTALNTMPIDRAEENLSALLAHGCDTVEAKLNAESLGMLGEAVVLAAGEVLPTEVIKLGEQFHHVDAAGQREILRAVHHILSPRPGAKDERRKRGEEVKRQSLLEHWLRDMQNQPLSRVIPRLYGRWEKGIGNPNCFGKAQLLYGFALRFGIECLGCTPIQTSRDAARERLKLASLAVLRASLADGIVLDPRLVRILTELYYSDVEAAEIPEAPHFGAVFRLCDGSWFLLDPHAHVEGALDSEIWKDSLDRHVMPILSSMGDVFPGLGVMANDPFQQEVLYDAAFEELITFAKEAALLQREFHTLGRSMIQKCITLFARSKAVEMIINEPDLLSSHDRWTLESILKGESSDALFEALGVKFAPGDAPIKDMPPELLQRLETALAVLDFLSRGRLFPAMKRARANWGEPLLEKTIGGVLEHIPRVLYALGFQRLVSVEERLVHPTMEFFRPDVRVGAELIGHINARTQRSESVIEALAEACPTQFSLLALATSPLRETGGVTHGSRTASICLRHLPVRYRVVDQGLQLLTDAGWAGFAEQQGDQHA